MKNSLSLYIFGTGSKGHFSASVRNFVYWRKYSCIYTYISVYFNQNATNKTFFSIFVFSFHKKITELFSQSREIWREIENQKKTCVAKFTSSRETQVEDMQNSAALYSLYIWIYIRKRSVRLLAQSRTDSRLPADAAGWTDAIFCCSSCMYTITIMYIYTKTYVYMCSCMHKFGDVKYLNRYRTIKKIQ